MDLVNRFCHICYLKTAVFGHIWPYWAFLGPPTKNSKVDFFADDFPVIYDTFLENSEKMGGRKFVNTFIG